jgi:hypothetical protein
VYLTAGVDDAVPGGERARRPADLVQCGGNLAVVVRVLVREDQIGVRLDGARLVTVHPLDLRRPLPAFVGEIEFEPTDSLRVSAGERVLDGRLPIEFGQLIGHNWQISPDTHAEVLLPVRKFAYRMIAAFCRIRAGQRDTRPVGRQCRCAPLPFGAWR